ncbi:uncharacterized protein Gasu_22600 [Galdieria sulphuraria]|uniref:HORMA domain-containing protein n=1 Tax=Galdieria sulphuraria TaxID=130081 RepID=M2W3S0_GALSU|nr:uncharacterized protein Gasu_22600 [Galdieria sulphuraria]EME30351.1 hypothetical protein Gasu_22600 [Galdieria sulphuraria]|eukprot:XP_005706871.1 hypothetical protein Gasu_22600 [Galdieria sulphuraria]
MDDWNNLWLDLTCCLIHTILYIHQVYPLVDTFERRERWGAVVYFCKSPIVADYLNPILHDIKSYFANGLLRSIRISLSHPNKQVNYQMQFPQTTPKVCTVDVILKWQELFRNALYKLLYVGQASSLVGTSTFQIYLQVVDNMEQQQQWKTVVGDPFVEHLASPLAKVTR